MSSANPFAVLADAEKKARRERKKSRKQRSRAPSEDVSMTAMFTDMGNTNWADCEDDDDSFLTGGFAAAPAPAAPRQRAQSAVTVEVRARAWCPRGRC